MPERIQLKRSKGWRKPEGAVVVSRPSRWGNPFVIKPVRHPMHGAAMFAVLWPDGQDVDWTYSKIEARRLATLMFRGYAAGEFDEPPVDVRLLPTLLRGKDLACWCPLDQPCHADVLLELANV